MLKEIPPNNFPKVEIYEIKYLTLKLQNLINEGTILSLNKELSPIIKSFVAKIESTIIKKNNLKLLIVLINAYSIDEILNNKCKLRIINNFLFIFLNDDLANIIEKIEAIN
jgi:hypothetical protein